MANTLLREEERYLNPDEVQALDKRRNRGLMLMVVSTQFLIVSIVLLLWIGQDMTYAPGWAHPVTYYFVIAVIVSACAGLAGMAMRRNTPEF